MPAHVPPVVDERHALLAFLAQQRQALRYAAYGLSDEQARTAPSASTLTVGGLVKHVTQVERSWVALVTGDPWPQNEQFYADGFRMGPTQTLDELLDDYALAAAETQKVVADATDLGQPVPVPRGVPWMPQDVDAWSVRWVLLHLIEETARHAGHADVVRESLDGASAMSLLAAADGWSSDGWIRPWQPAAAAEGDR
jgi:uncharacterized damage-inducible protein DinB